MTAVEFRKGLLEARDLIEQMDGEDRLVDLMRQALNEVYAVADDPFAPTEEAVRRLRLVHQALGLILEAHTS